ncbi:hypothetical protein BaRGS_00035120 [Batillaria attramentaria]|uniref:Secreted protein n=1 Tax=Batillaria attramentaria TaxID=370345 RepID=A0ABD0JGX8_9CAEN
MGSSVMVVAARAGHVFAPAACWPGVALNKMAARREGGKSHLYTGTNCHGPRVVGKDEGEVVRRCRLRRESLVNSSEPLTGLNFCRKLRRTSEPSAGLELGRSPQDRQSKNPLLPSAECDTILYGRPCHVDKG